MKSFTIAALVTLVSVVAAQDPLSSIPACPLQCVTTAALSDGCSSLTDFGCHCKKSDLIDKTKDCVAKCSCDDQVKAAKGLTDLCTSYGVTLSVPAPACAGASSAPASSAAPATSSAAPASSGAASSAPASSAPASSGAPSSSGAAASSGSPAPTGSATKPSGSAAPSGSSSGGIPQATNAAAVFQASAGLVGAAALAMLAL